MLPRIRVMYAVTLITALTLLGAHTRAQVVSVASAATTAVAAAPAPTR